MDIPEDEGAISRPRKNLIGPKSLILNAPERRLFNAFKSPSLLLAIAMSSTYTSTAMKDVGEDLINKLVSDSDCS